MQTHLRRVRRIVHHRMLAAAPAAVILVLVASMSLAVGAATLLSELWTAGGLSAGTDSAGQAARIAADASGNLAIVSGPSGGRISAVTSYTADGTSAGAVRHADVGHVRRRLGGCCFQRRFRRDRAQPGLHGGPIANTMLRYDSNGTLLWRVDFPRHLPRGRAARCRCAGNAYLAWNAVGSGLFVQKYSPAGSAVVPGRLDGGRLRPCLLAGVEPRRRRCGGDRECLGGAT